MMYPEIISVEVKLYDTNGKLLFMRTGNVAWNWDKRFAENMDEIIRSWIPDKKVYNGEVQAHIKFICDIKS